MTASPGSVRLQLLLRATCRNDKDIAGAQQALRALGLEVTGVGKASLSARATPDAFATVFGDERPDELPIPAPLADYVESITIAPQHIAMAPEPDSKDTDKERRGKR